MGSQAPGGIDKVKDNRRIGLCKRDIQNRFLKHEQAAEKIVSCFDRLSSNGPRFKRINELAVRPELVEGRTALTGIALGSCIQIALFVAPLLVLSSYFIAPQPLELGRAEMGSLFMAVLIGAIVAGDGRSNWYKGVQLITVYVIIALMFLPPAGRQHGGASGATLHQPGCPI